MNKLGRDADAFGRGAFKTKRVSQQQGEARPDGLAHEIKVVPAVVVNGFVHAAQQRVYSPVYAGEGFVKGAWFAHKVKNQALFSRTAAGAVARRRISSASPRNITT